MEDQSPKGAEQFEHVINLLEDSHADLEHALSGLPDELCLKKPLTGGWSIIEVIEHLVIIEGRIPRLLQLKLPEQELASDISNIQEKDAQLVERVSSYTAKINAPDFVKPTGRYASCSQALNDLSTARQRTLAYVASTPPYLRGRLLPHPILGPIDGYQWLLSLGAHTQRHTKQIHAIRATLQ